MLETQQNLYQLGIFDLVQVEQQNPESTDTYQNVVVRVDEANRFAMRYGIGYQERDHLRDPWNSANSIYSEPVTAPI